MELTLGKILIGGAGFLITIFLAIIGYFAKSTKEDLQDNDNHLESRIFNIEKQQTEVKVILTEMKGDIRVLSENINIYKQSKHDVKNKNAEYEGSMPLINEALTKALKILNENIS